MSSRKYDSPVTGLLITWARRLLNNPSSASSWIALHVAAKCPDPIEEHLEVDLDEAPALGLLQTQVETRPTVTPLKRTGLDDVEAADVLGGVGDNLQHGRLRHRWMKSTAVARTTARVTTRKNPSRA